MEQITKENSLNLEDIETDGDVHKFGYTNCLGTIDRVYPMFSEEILDNWYRTWIWENETGQRIATWDSGNSWCTYLCEGSYEGLSAYIKKIAVESEIKHQANTLEKLWSEGQLTDFAYQISQLYSSADYRFISAVMQKLKGRIEQDSDSSKKQLEAM